MDTQDIQLRDKDAELQNLRLECLEKASELTNTLILIDSARKESLDIDVKKSDFDTYCTKKRLELKEENDRIDSGNVLLFNLKETSSIELRRLKDDTKAANKDLSWINDKVFKAKEELLEILKEKKEQSGKVLDLTHLVEKIPNIQSDILFLEDKRDKIRLEISEMIDSSTLELTKAKEELIQITQSVEKKIEEANQAEYTCKKYTDELYSHMNDYEVIRSRLETVYKTKFPELTLNI